MKINGKVIIPRTSAKGKENVETDSQQASTSNVEHVAEDVNNSKNVLHIVKPLLSTIFSLQQWNMQNQEKRGRE